MIAAVAVCSVESVDPTSGPRAFAIPKSTSFGMPWGVTRMFAALRSRCNTPAWWIDSTASQIWATSSIRFRIDSSSSSQ